MQPIFYRSSPQEAILPVQVPVNIQQASGRVAVPPAAPPPSVGSGTARAFVNSERNSRVAYASDGHPLHVVWRTDLPAHFAAANIVAAAGRVIVHGPDGWLLLDQSGHSRGNDRDGDGELTLDTAHRVFYTAGTTGYVEGHSLSDGRREFFITAYFGEDYQRLMIDRHDRRMLIVSIEMPANPHTAVPPSNSVVEVQDLGAQPEISDAGRLKSAKRVDYLMATTTHLIPAVHGDQVALAVEGSIYVADSGLTLQRQLTGDFQPLLLSMDEVPRLYLIMRVGTGLEFWIVALNGQRVARTALPNGFEPIAPPIVALDHSVFLISRQRILSIDSAGAIRWEQLSGSIAGAVVTPAGSLLATCGSEVAVYDQAGKRTSLFHADDDVLTTPPAVNETGEILVAGQRRVYCLR